MTIFIENWNSKTKFISRIKRKAKMKIKNETISRKKQHKTRRQRVRIVQFERHDHSLRFYSVQK
jgi:hypothetical protein